MYCTDRALIVHYYSPYVPSIDLIDFPGILPLARSSLSSSLPTTSSNFVSLEYDSEWTQWRENRDEILHNFILQNPKAIYLALVEANMSNISQSRIMNLIESWKIQVSILSSLLL